MKKLIAVACAALFALCLAGCPHHHHHGPGGGPGGGGGPGPGPHLTATP